MIFKNGPRPLITDAGPVIDKRHGIAPIQVVFGILAASIFALNLVPRENWIIDDALIYQNFVRNALSGNGFVYTPGYMVEGYSSPLWVLILTFAGLLGARGFLAAKAIGAVCGIATCFLAALTPSSTRSHGFILGASVLLALQSSLVWWSASGMETPLLAFLLALLALLAFGMITMRPLTVAVAGGLIAITRPESPLYLLAVWAWFLFEARSRRMTAARASALAALSLVPLVAWQIYRLMTYGTLIANSALAKVSLAHGASAVLKGGEYLLQTWDYFQGPWIILLCGAAAILFNALRLRRAENASIACLLLLVLGLAFPLLVGGDWMPRGRFLVPLIPLMLMLPMNQFEEYSKAWQALLVAGLFIGIGFAVHQLVTDYQVDRRNGNIIQAQWPHSRRPFVDPLDAMYSADYYAKYILQYTVPGDRIWHVDIGQSGYLANDLILLDQLGLVSRYEAEYLNGRHSGQELLDHFGQAAPSVAFIVVDPERKSSTPATFAIAPELKRNYTLKAQIQWDGPLFLQTYVRNDALERQPDASRMRRWAQAAEGLRFDESFLLAP